MAPTSARDWSELARELDVWHAAGRTATLWWRDDDACGAGAALARLLEIATQYGVPLALAVIPARAERALAEHVRTAPAVAVLQHGYAHRNHAPSGVKRSELGDHRPATAIDTELERGWRRLAGLFGAAALPVLVPPWNRIGPGVSRRLPRLGYRGLSTFGPRSAREPLPGLCQVNSHLDLIDWRGTRGFVGVPLALGALLGHLRARRVGRADAGEPTGLLTHHLVHDDACWEFVSALLEQTRQHPAARWLDLGELLACGAT